MTEFLRYTLLTSESNACNSLEGVSSYSDGDVCFVQTTNHYYRFFAANTTAPDGAKIIAPAGVTPPAPGRWFQQGPPGTRQPNPGHPAYLSACTGLNGAVCVTQQLSPNVGDTAQVGNFDFSKVLDDLGNPVNQTVKATLHVAGVRNVDGLFPQAWEYPVAFELDASGNIVFSGAAVGIDPNTQETGVNNTPYGGDSNYGDGSGAVGITATSTGADRIVTVSMALTSAALPSVSGKLCLEVFTPTPI